MSAIHLAKSAVSALTRDKPLSSITNWVDILTGPNYDDEAYDGIPELVDSINIQAAGPTEASRAVRKKLKHGNAHQQYRALVILNALVENCGHKFQTTFADGQLTDALRHLASDSNTDPKVKRKLTHVFASWHRQFKDDPSMSLVAGFYKPTRSSTIQPRVSVDVDRENEHEKQRLAKEDAKRQAKEAKEAEKLKRETDKSQREAERLQREREAKRKQAAPKSKRKPFNFEQEKPQILSSIATASQNTSNLVNAITLVNTENDSIQANQRVQDCLEEAKQTRKQIVRYIQLCENEEMIGALIETNERIIAAIETYDTLSKAKVSTQDVEDVQKGLAAVNITDSELSKLQDKQRAAVARSKSGTARGKDRADGHLHPDLEDLSFGNLGGAEQSNLPPPLRPSVARSDSDDDENRGSLSDYSDYESSDEETHKRASTSAGRRYVDVSAENLDLTKDPKRGLLEEDPFADPFADSHGVDSNSLIDTASINSKKW